MKMMLWTLIVAIAAAVLTGCGSDKKEESLGRQVSITQEFKGQQGPFPDRGFSVVQNQSNWTALWAGRPAPAVDFEQYSVLVALMGQQPTTGYSINISDVRDLEAQVIVMASETRPRADEAVAQVITFPYHMVVTPKITDPVSFTISGQQAPPVTVQQQFNGEQSLVEAPQTAVIRDAAAWHTFWTATFGPAAVAPVVDFNRYMATAVLLGRKPSAGYAAFITGAHILPERIEVTYRATSPAIGEPVMQHPTSPYAIAILPVSPQAIAFRPTASTAVAAAP